MSTTTPARAAPKWPGIALRLIRLIAGGVAIFISQISIVSNSTSPDPALEWAVLLLGVFIVAHLAIEVGFARLPVRSGAGEPVPDPFSSVANVLVTTPAIVLGLLAVFGTTGTGTLTTVVKVAAVSLVISLLLAIVLSGLLSMQEIKNPPRSTVIRLFFNLTLWSLAFGLLGLALGVVYRT